MGGCTAEGGGGGGGRSHERVSLSKQKGGRNQDSERYNVGVCHFTQVTNYSVGRSVCKALNFNPFF